MADPKALGYNVREGDLVIARTGASVGKSYRYRPDDGDLVFAGFLISIRPDPDRLDPKYLACILQSKYYWDWVATESVRSGQPGINAQQLAGLEIDPPDVNEQRAVANAVAEVEDLAEALECLIAKKRDVKQGVMQELLSGRTRLPGFDDEWRETTLGAMSAVVGGGTPSTRVSAYWGGEIPWFTPAEIAQKGSGSVTSSDRMITQEGLTNSAATLLPAGAVLVTSRASLGHCAVAEVPVATNQGFTSLVPRDMQSTWFLYYWMQQNSSELESRAAGSTFLEISASKVSDIPLKVPGLVEQCSIGSALRDADTEISALERRLESARAVKTGMMQDLLTGRTRLLVKEDA
ncbi:restriction endonuclease subunit S [Brachybacterium paraconglomeratum]|uniref:restriction endonuclease subunit S n=1 Tax=Brachybacterium paraconglomeratum TaxID=173362 RepID=UPI0024900A9A|nr:restriction endonuclease subunit S [Brachybacterium paraconglomeratum]